MLYMVHRGWQADNPADTMGLGSTIPREGGLWQRDTRQLPTEAV